MSNDEIIRFVDLDVKDVRLQELSGAERAALADVNRHVAMGENLSAIMDYVFESTEALFPCDRIGLAFIDDNGTRVSAHWARARYSPVLLGHGYTEDLNGSSLAAILHRGCIRIINDLEAYLESKPNSQSTQLLIEEGVRSSMTCPLYVGNRPIGFLFRSSREKYVYDTHQVQLHVMLAERLSQAVEKAYRIEQLEKANQAYRELVSFVSHEVKNPIASIVMDTRVLTGGYLGELTSEQKTKLESMARKAQHVLQLARDYLDLATLDDPGFSAQFRDVEDLIANVVEPAIELCASNRDDRDMTLEREFGASPMPVTCQPGLIGTAIVNLIGNAVKYGDMGGKIRLSVENAPDKFRVTVWNEGPGFSKMDAGRLFRRFSRLATPANVQIEGTGLGLYTAWRVVKAHGGFIRAEAEPGKWAEFSFEIPQPPIPLPRK